MVHGITTHGTITTNQTNGNTIMQILTMMVPWQIGTLVRAGMNQTPTILGNHTTRGGINNPTTGKPQTAGIEGIELRPTHMYKHFQSGDTGTDQDPSSLLPPISMLWQPF